MDIKTSDDARTTSPAGFYLRQLQQYTAEPNIHSNISDIIDSQSHFSQALSAATQESANRILAEALIGEDIQILSSSSSSSSPAAVAAPATVQCGPVPIQTTTDTSNIQSLGNIANEKNSIYRHPLFPLLRVLFEKCEIATNSIEHVNSVTFDNEMRVIVTQMAKENKPFFTEDSEVNTLMLKALQVLVIHLLELEKVNELCKDFCTRYISCLKSMLNSENIMRTLDIKNTPPESPTTDTNDEATENKEVAESIGNTVNQITEQLPMKIENNENNFLARSLSTSNTMEIGGIENEPENDLRRSLSADSGSELQQHLGGMTVEQLTSGFLSKKNKGGKRGTLPKSATNVLKAWLFQHLVHPYPSEEEKKQLAEQTNLSNLQVNNWFINARRRILQPMLDSSNSHFKNSKRSKHPRNTAQKNWSNTMVAHNNTSYPRPIESTDVNTQQTIINNQQQQLEIMVSPVMHHPVTGTVMQPTPGTVLLNLGGEGAHNQHVIITQPLQFVQVNQLPIQAVAASAFLPVHSISTQQPVVSTQQAVLSTKPTQ